MHRLPTSFFCTLQPKPSQGCYVDKVPQPKSRIANLSRRAVYRPSDEDERKDRLHKSKFVDKTRPRLCFGLDVAVLFQVPHCPQGNDQ